MFFTQSTIFISIMMLFIFKKTTFFNQKRFLVTIKRSSLSRLKYPSFRSKFVRTDLAIASSRRGASSSSSSSVVIVVVVVVSVARLRRDDAKMRNLRFFCSLSFPPPPLLNHAPNPEYSLSPSPSHLHTNTHSHALMSFFFSLSCTCDMTPNVFRLDRLDFIGLRWIGLDWKTAAASMNLSHLGAFSLKY